MQIAIIGGGAWGSALAHILGLHYPVTVYLREMPPKHLLNYKLKEFSKNIETSMDFSKLHKANYIIMAIPSKNMREFLEKNQSFFNINQKIIISTKGIDLETKKLMLELIKYYLNNEQSAILAGPNFADEIAKGLTSAADIASTNMKYAEEVKTLFEPTNLKLYPTIDVITVQIASCVKNIVAILSGMIKAENLGENMQASIINQGMKEIFTLSKALGGIGEANLFSVVSDLILTATSLKSRNMLFGYEFIMNNSKTPLYLVEGLNSVTPINQLARAKNICLPLCFLVEDIINNSTNLSKVNDLL